MSSNKVVALGFGGIILTDNGITSKLPEKFEPMLTLLEELDKAGYRINAPKIVHAVRLTVKSHE
jgi:hypothetical protein